MSFLFQLVLACERPFEKMEESGNSGITFLKDIVGKRRKKKDIIFALKRRSNIMKTACLSKNQELIRTIDDIYVVSY